MIVLRLPEAERPDYKWPQGPVYRGNLAKVLSGLEYATLSCIGDVVTMHCLQAGITPTLAAIDGYTRRRDMEGTSDIPRLASAAGMNIARIQNPRGSISLDAFEAVCNTLESRRPTLLLVEGEEDLLALPAIACSPPGGIVIYGVPAVGATVVRVNLLRSRLAQLRLLRFIPRDVHPL